MQVLNYNFVIEMIFMGIFATLILVMFIPVVQNYIWIALLFGIATCLFPWFWLQRHQIE